MGEEPWRVHVSGAPSLDNLRHASLPDRAELERRFGLNLNHPPLLVTFHPVTRQADDVGRQIRVLLDALRQVDVPVVITAPNADVGGDVIRAELGQFIAERPLAALVENFGSLNYLAMLRESAAMVGNSSSGLLETPAQWAKVYVKLDQVKGSTSKPPPRRRVDRKKDRRPVAEVLHRRTRQPVLAKKA